MPFDISTKIEAWRAQLLDMTKRNRLINFKSGRGGGIPLLYPNPGELWHLLITDSQPLTFPWKRDLIELPEDSEEEDGAAGGPTPAEPDEPPEAACDQDVLGRCRGSSRLRPDHLLTELTDKRLATRLKCLYDNARESLAEQGVITLYAAFGFLRWFESDDSREEICSPLLLVPVRLAHDGVDSPWRLQAEDEEILPNHSLVQRLVGDFRLHLPFVEDEAISPDDPSWRIDYLQAVRHCVRDHPRWEVLDQAALGSFNFQKLAMWEDLGRNHDRIKAHDLCRAIAGDHSVALRLPTNLPAAQELDEKTRPDETHHILDADSSQHAAIIAATRGANLVLDGPPGTGKSQTIANTIAEFLAAGKTVLFVSEKAAALEVVKRRLDERQLGDFCLELHSHKANKRAVVAELGRCLNLVPKTYRDTTDDLARLFEKRSELNAYVRELHTVRKPLGRSAYQVHGELARLDRAGSVSRCPIPEVLERDATYLRKATDLLANLPACRSAFEAGDRHPWRNCLPTVFSPLLRDDVQYHCKRLAASVGDLLEGCSCLRRLGLVTAQPTRTEWLAALKNAQRAMYSPSWWDPARRRELQAVIRQRMEHARTAEDLRVALGRRLAPKAFADPNASLIRRANRYRSPWTRLLPGWWFIRAKASAWYAGKRPQTAILLEDIQQLAAYHGSFDFCRHAQEEIAADLLTDEAGKPDWAGTLASLEVVDRMERDGEAASQQPLRDCLAEAIRRGDVTRTAGFDESWKYLTTKLFDPVQAVSTGVTIDRTPLSELQTWLAERAADAPRIYEWIRFREIQREAAHAGLRPVLQEVLDGQVPLTEAADAFRVRFLRLWLDALYEQVAALRHFSAEEQERRVEQFHLLDRSAVESAPDRIRNLLLTHPDRLETTSGAPHGSPESGILLREVNKKLRHLPLRKLFTAIPSLLPRLKPCLMMSPLAVSTYLQSPDLQFDLVIFDEASQVRPHDAICAIYRGRQLMVAGDQKQLPPTSFFEKSQEDDGATSDEADGAETALSDYESVLDICCTLGLPRRRLRWHYRSRREGLIAFANHHVYADELVTFPSVYDLRDNPAVTFEYVATGCWKAGASGGFNSVEARRTAELVLEHFRGHPEKSLGVIAFSQRQQMRIFDELEKLRREYADVEDFFREDRPEPFFVKNLETVQGDERDVVFLSVGYGPDNTGRVAMRFGPLNNKDQAGELQVGARRLNVAVTRARERMTVISSLRAQDIDLSRTKAEGVRLLRAYLDYADRGVEALGAGVTEDGDRDFDSPFEHEVYDELTRQGLTVHRQVGCSGFRIDLAVVDPRAPGRYLLGVECDGATYHSSATARDRDRLRQEVLESLGWRICRVWSTDWVRDCAGQVGRVLAALEKAKGEESGNTDPAGPLRTRPSPSPVVMKADLPTDFSHLMTPMPGLVPIRHEPL